MDTTFALTLSLNPVQSGLSTPAREATISAEEALVHLLAEHEQALYRYVLSLAKDADVAGDCVQDTFLRAYEALSTGKTVNVAWLFKVAHNRTMDEFRRRRRVRPDLDTLERMPAASAGPSGEGSDQRMIIEQAMNQLAPLDREVLYLFVLGGFKTDEIGKIFGVRGTAIRQRLYRAREKARQALAEAA